MCPALGIAQCSLGQVRYSVRKKDMKSCTKGSWMNAGQISEGNPRSPEFRGDGSLSYHAQAGHINAQEDRHLAFATCKPNYITDLRTVRMKV